MKMTTAKALRELDHAQRIINEHIGEGFVTDFCMERDGGLGFCYDPERYAEIARNTSEAA